jgi:hypothetical protein
VEKCWELNKFMLSGKVFGNHKKNLNGLSFCDFSEIVWKWKRY